MRNCPECGAELDGSNPRFCGECGKPILQSDAPLTDMRVEAGGTSAAKSVGASIGEVLASSASAVLPQPQSAANSNGQEPAHRGHADSQPESLRQAPTNDDVPIVIDINRNRFYMEGRGGVLELRILNGSATNATIAIAVESTLCEWIGSSG